MNLKGESRNFKIKIIILVFITIVSIFLPHVYSSIGLLYKESNINIGVSSPIISFSPSNALNTTSVLGTNDASINITIDNSAWHYSSWIQDFESSLTTPNYYWEEYKEPPGKIDIVNSPVYNGSLAVRLNAKGKTNQVYIRYDFGSSNNPLYKCLPSNTIISLYHYTNEYEDSSGIISIHLGLGYDSTIDYEIIYYWTNGADVPSSVFQVNNVANIRIGSVTLNNWIFFERKWYNDAKEKWNLNENIKVLSIALKVYINLAGKNIITIFDFIYSKALFLYIADILNNKNLPVDIKLNFVGTPSNFLHNFTTAFYSLDNSFLSKQAYFYHNDGTIININGTYFSLGGTTTITIVLFLSVNTPEKEINIPMLLYVNLNGINEIHPMNIIIKS
jgi:hypothetical protein